MNVSVCLSVQLINAVSTLDRQALNHMHLQLSKLRGCRGHKQCNQETGNLWPSPVYIHTHHTQYTYIHTHHTHTCLAAESSQTHIPLRSHSVPYIHFMTTHKHTRPHTHFTYRAFFYFSYRCERTQLCQRVQVQYLLFPPFSTDQIAFTAYVDERRI